jgi:hypothetical protein
MAANCTIKRVRISSLVVQHLIKSEVVKDLDQFRISDSYLRQVVGKEFVVIPLCLLVRSHCNPF